MRIRAIMVNTFREAVRDRILYIMLVFGILLIVSSRLLVPLSLGQQQKIVRDMGLAMISLFGALIAILTGAQLVHKELERKTIYTIISKPIRRFEFILGKYLGLLLTLLGVVAIMTAGFFALVFWVDHTLSPALLKAIGFTYLELMVVTAVALLFSTFSTPILSAVWTFLIYALGHLSGDLKLLAQNLPTRGGKSLLLFLYYIVPNLENFNIRGPVVYNEPITLRYTVFVLAYTLLYAVIVLAITALVFRRREFR